LAEEEDEFGVEELEQRVVSAFLSAYPAIAEDRLVHMARNFTQVLNGVISIGEMAGGPDDIDHMDVANGMVFSCVSSTYLEELQDGEWNPILEDPSLSRISEEEMQKLKNEIVARVADWLIGLEVLRNADPGLYRDFVRGAVALGATDWETDRGKLSY
jgi:hypothetical protein